MTSNINKRIAIGAAWMIGLRQVDRLIGLVSITILARLLLPDDFGLVVYATSLVAIVEMFFQFGFETVLIRDQDADRDSYNTAWTLKIIIGAILCALLLLSAYPASVYFDEPRVQEILYWVAFTPLLRGLENIGIVNFQKNMQFSKEFKFRFSVRVISTVTTIALAYTLRSHWALVVGMLVNSSLGMIFSYLMNDYRPRLCLANYARVFGFSKWLLFQNILQGLTSRAPIFVIGRFFEASVVAFYNMSDELSNMATGEIAAPIRRALFPGVMSIADDEKKMVDTIISTISVIGFVGLPVAVGIGLTAPVAVPLLLGENWLEIIPIMQILAIYGASMALYSNSHVIYYAQNKPQITVVVTGARLILLVPALLYYVPTHGAIGAAWAWTAANIFVTVLEYGLFYKMVTVRVIDIVNAMWRSICSVALMGVVVHYVMEILLSYDERFPLAVELLIAAGTGAACYGSAALLLWLVVGKPRGAESYILSILLRKRAAGEAQVD